MNFVSPHEKYFILGPTFRNYFTSLYLVDMKERLYIIDVSRFLFTLLYCIKLQKILVYHSYKR